MFKKTTAILIALLLMLALAACAPAEGTDTQDTTNPPGTSPVTDAPDTDTPETNAPTEEPLSAFEQYNRYLEEMNLNGTGDVAFDIDMITFIKMKMGNEIEETTSESNMKFKTVDGKEEFSLTVDMGELGFMEIYTDGVVVVYNINGEVATMNAVDIAEDIYSSDDTEIFPEFDEDGIISGEVDNIDGNTKYTFVLDSNKIAELTQSLYEEMGLDAFDMPGTEIFMGDLTMSFTVDKDGTPIEMYESIEMKITVEGETIEISMEISLIFNAFGSDVQITIPQ